MPLQTTTIKIDTELKENALRLFSDLGMDMETAVTVFLRQAVREQAIPFRVGNPIPNRETLEAMREVELMKKEPQSYRSYTDVDMMVEELLA
ncbi:type II toxin-antitoxin system RelB/DinJ family antitoxin [Treponema sp. HNW]|uniref:type II toxin-antitoxin system RelB/DinJ family antitoxin n=1 Tax=Treponema sp. HNW TaxID=3116654 RepID=UPI003D132B5A